MIWLLLISVVFCCGLGVALCDRNREVDRLLDLSVEDDRAKQALRRENRGLRTDLAAVMAHRRALEAANRRLRGHLSAVNQRRWPDPLVDAPGLTVWMPEFEAWPVAASADVPAAERLPSAQPEDRT